MIRRPRRSPLFPSPTLFRSRGSSPCSADTSASCPPRSGERRRSCVAEALGLALGAILALVAELDLAAHARARRHGEGSRSEEHTSELQSPCNLVCRLLLEKK